MTDVPSNLIPTRITELPEYSGASADGYMPYVYSGRTYKAQLSYLMNGTLSSAIAIGTTGNASGVRLLRGQTAIGQTPSDTQYEMNSGGQPAYEPTLLQVADVEGKTALAEYLRFYNDAKPLSVQYGKNRGDGVPGSPTFGRKTLSGDRLFLMGIYGGKDSDGTTTAFAHAGYLTWTAESDNTGSNEQDAALHLRPGSAQGITGAGNGLQINRWSQTALPGPNQLQYALGLDYQAILRLGAPSATCAPLRFTPGTLSTSPVEGAIEQDVAGTFYLTQGLSTGTLSRRVIVAEANPTVTNATSAGGTVTYVSGAGFARVVLTVGGVDITPSTFLTLAFDNLPANAVVVGSRDTTSGNIDGGHEFSFFAKSGNRIQIALLSGTLLASGVYNFCVMWRVP